MDGGRSRDDFGLELVVDGEAGLLPDQEAAPTSPLARRTRRWLRRACPTLLGSLYSCLRWPRAPGEESNSDDTNNDSMWARPWPIILSTILVPSMVLVFLMVRSWQIVVQRTGNDTAEHPCRPLQHWLIAYAVLISLHTCVLVMLPIVLPVLLGVVGWLVREKLGDACREEQPLLWNFVDEVAVLTAFHFVVSMAGYFKLWRRVGQKRATSQRLAQQILASAPVQDPPAGTVCPICLEGDDQEATRDSAPLWRALRCKHYFHHECLEEWLARSCLCPVCRHDLRPAAR